MHLVRLQNIRYVRGSRVILDNIQWQMKSGDHWVILGANGSGKTTLLSLILGYQWPTEGLVEVLGHPYGTVDLREIRKRIGFVSHQLGEWLTAHHPGTRVYDVVAAGRQAIIGREHQGSNVSADSVWAALERFDIHHRAQAPYQHLSQGEKTRVLLARAWMADSQLIILDEPCSGLDLKGREQLLSLIEGLLAPASTPGILYVTHHTEEILPGFSHVLMLKDGQVLAEGPKATVLTEPLLSRVLDVPVALQWVDNRPWIHVKPSPR
ncbi:ABC transporter related protein [Sulfobacillus acidophilus DSM 10332]|uniref:ABC transporter related protein n=1 Tax=Sulfobacillus acidophilus (strain ATCC 700253 / DSM 10332 / NAL) TaxID=679936 RepID=G8U0J4_SULAD|nr:ABC transporter related protein [Sulfobacillus acidophilus DSM 10332]